MNITTEQVGTVLSISVEGDVNSGNAGELNEVLATPKGVDRINLDLAQVPYMSSAGLRALLVGEKAMKKVGGSMVITNVQPDVMEIFEITGFASILTVE